MGRVGFIFSYVIVCLLLGLHLVQADTPPAATCTSSDLQIVKPLGNYPADIWAQRADPKKTGKYVDPKETIGFEFNGDINPDLFKQQVSVTGSVPKDKSPCASPEPTAAPLETHVVNFTTIKNFLGFKQFINMYHAGDKDFADDLFIPNCKYTLEIKTGPLTTDGRCLAAAVKYPFWIAPDTRTPFERETMDVEDDLATGEVRSFRIKPNVTVKPDEIWSRYRDKLGWRGYGTELDWIVQEGEPRDIPNDPGVQSIQFQQKYKWLPVEGGGFVVTTKDGFVQSVMGRFVKNLNLEVNLEVKSPATEAAALKAAKAAIGATIQYISEPKGELVIVSDGTSAGAESFRLAWRFELTALQPSLVSEQIDIDARDPTKPPLGRYPLIWHSQLPTLDDIEADPVDEIKGTGFPIYDSTTGIPRTDFTVGRYKDQDGAEYDTLRSKKSMPAILTLYEDESGKLHPIYTYTNSKGIFAFDGAAGNPPGQIEGVSVHWAATKAVEYVNKLDGNMHPDTIFSGFPAVAPLVLVVSNNPKRFTGDENAFMMMNCHGIVSIPGAQVKPCLFFNLNTSTGINAPVSPEAVGHELYHLFTLYFRPNLKWIKMASAPVLEGLADFFGKQLEFFIRGQNATWMVGKDLDPIGSGFYNLAKPENSPVQGVPSTYKGELYNQIDANCPPEKTECGVHKKSILVGHAFYLMIYGQPPVVFNDLGCSAVVKPLDPDPGLSLVKALNMFWKITTKYMGNHEAFGFTALRDASMFAALEPYGDFDFTNVDYPADVQTVQDAWHAVGVGNSSDARKLFRVPSYAKEKVEPWQLTIGVTLPPDAPPQQLQISNNLDFVKDVQKDKDMQEMETGLLQITDANGISHTVNGQVIYLKPSTHYFWRYRDSPQDTKQTWSKCNPISHFSTASKAPVLTNPPNPMPSLGGGPPNIRKFAFGDSLKWSPVEKATKYFVRISDKVQDLCGPGGDGTTPPDPTTQPKEWMYVTEPKLDPEKTGFALDPEKTYYWYAKALTNDDKNKAIEGDCSNGGVGLSFQTTKISHPDLISPQEGISITYEPNTPVTFEWGNVAGAIRYELMVVPPSSTGKPPDFSSNQRSTSVDAPQDDKGTITGQIPELPFSEGGYCWRVRAILTDDRTGEWAKEKCYATVIRKPKLTAPANGAYLSYADFLISNYRWQPIPGAANYKLSMRNRNQDGSASAVLMDFTVPSQELSAWGSMLGVKYPAKETNLGRYGNCWSVTGIMAKGKAGPESDIFCFMVGPSKPSVLDYTIGDWTGDGYPVQLRWQNAHTPGDFKITEIVDYPNGVSGQPVYITRKNIAPKEGLSSHQFDEAFPGSTHVTWSVMATNPYADASGFDKIRLPVGSDSASFETPPDKPKAPPPPTTTTTIKTTCSGTIAAPTANSPVGATAMTAKNNGPPLYPLKWSSVPDAQSYVVKVYSYNQFGVPPVKLVWTSPDPITATEYIPPQLAIGAGFFYWSVQAKDACGNLSAEGTGGYYCAYTSCW